MSTLRLIILVAGIVFIAVVYIWEILKQRKLHRKQTISRAVPEHELPRVRVPSSTDADRDYSEILSELNQSLAESKRKEEFTPAEAGPRSRIHEKAPAARLDDLYTELPETRDMFGELEDIAPGRAGTGDVSDQDIDEQRIITLHVTAMPASAFNGDDILDAVNNVGMEYGEMNIFHHFGMGEMQSDRPLFSLADMYEPGSFDLEHIDNHRTRGLTLFFCLPVRVDAEVVFELMLNTAQRLADILQGEIRGGDHNLLNDDRIMDIRNKLKLRAQA